jgi:hypothetical protein
MNTSILINERRNNSPSINPMFPGVVSVTSTLRYVIYYDMTFISVFDMFLRVCMV